MSKHTPGPWTLDHGQLGLDLRNHIPVNAKAHTGLAQVVWKMEDDERTPMCEANARLIAAAPDLLEALQSVLSGAVQYQLRDGEQCVLDARAAIAKATGEAA